MPRQKKTKKRTKNRRHSTIITDIQYKDLQIQEDFPSNMVTVQPAVKRETRNVAFITVAGVILMLLVFFVLHLFFPDSVPFNYTVILAGVCAGAVAILNFFLAPLFWLVDLITIILSNKLVLLA